MSKPTPDRRVTTTQLSDETLRQMVEVQAKEQALRSQELQIRAKELDYQSKHATEMLGAQERDREKEREHSRRMQRGPLVALVIVVIAVLTFIGVALYMNKDAAVQEILKLVLTFAAGGGAGYGIRAAKKDPDED